MGSFAWIFPLVSALRSLISIFIVWPVATFSAFITDVLIVSCLIFWVFIKFALLCWLLLWDDEPFHPYVCLLAIISCLSVDFLICRHVDHTSFKIRCSQHFNSSCTSIVTHVHEGLWWHKPHLAPPPSEKFLQRIIWFLSTFVRAFCSEKKKKRTVRNYPAFALSWSLWF